MLDVELFAATDTERAAEVFHRDGFVVIKDALNAEQLATARRGADRVIAEQMAAVDPAKANRGLWRYSFGQQLQHPEWQMLVDLDTVLPTVDAIWASKDYTCSGAGGDYSAPGAKIQALHSDMGEMIHDPRGHASIRDLPAPFIVVNFPLVDFTVENGATRFVPCTQRSRERIPTIEEEPLWMQQNYLCAPAGSALVRDVRCWHGGSENRSDIIRPMVSVGYFAPWYSRPSIASTALTREQWLALSPRAQTLCRYQVHT